MKMKKLIGVFVFVGYVALSLSPAFAGGNGYGDHEHRNDRPTAHADAEAEANVSVRVGNVNKNTTTNKNINNNSLSIETGPVSVVGGSNSATANPVVNANPAVTTSIHNVVEAPRIAAQAPGIPESGGTNPQIFWDKPTMPANVLGINMTIAYLKVCKPKYKAGVDTRDIVEKGASGLTRIIFTPHANYVEQKSDAPVKEVSIAMPPDSSYSDRYVCLGTIKTEALMKEASTSQLDTLYNDAGRFAAEKIKGGYDEVYLITVPSVIAVNLGVSNKGGGYGIAPALSDLAGDTFRGLGAALSGNKGDTFPAAQLGTTFLVLAKPKQGEHGVEFNIGSLLNLPVHSPVR
jgi:hypothetical protein